MIFLFQMLFSTCDVLIETLKNHIQEIVILKLVTTYDSKFGSLLCDLNECLSST